MKNLLKLEQLAQFVLSIFLFSQLSYSWWVFLLCILLPNISLLAYLINTRAGTWIYNLFHHKLTGIAVLIIGFSYNVQLLALAGIVLFGHAALDRIFGYGLKYSHSFHATHLGPLRTENSNISLIQ